MSEGLGRVPFFQKSVALHREQVLRGTLNLANINK